VIVAHHYPFTGEIVRAELDDTQVDAALTRLRGTAARAEADSKFRAMPGQHCASCVDAQPCPAARRNAA
jgi:hypothetical protein